MHTYTYCHVLVINRHAHYKRIQFILAHTHTHVQYCIYTETIYKPHSHGAGGKEIVNYQPRSRGVNNMGFNHYR